MSVGVRSELRVICDVCVCFCQLDCAEIVLRTIREAAAAADASADVAVRLSDCDKLVEKYAKLAFDFSAADHCNEPGEYCF